MARKGDYDKVDWGMRDFSGDTEASTEADSGDVYEACRQGFQDVNSLLFNFGHGVGKSLGKMMELSTKSHHIIYYMLN